jgi:hypothetical protein
MCEFTARANIENFKAQLLTSYDDVQKVTLGELLSEKNSSLRGISPTDTNFR